MSGPSEIVKILFLAANPSGTERRRLDEEIRRIELALERAKRREQFKIIQKWAVTDDDLRRSMLDHEPEYVHFSGHGGGSQGLAFVDNLGRLQVISGDSLGRLFELCADHVRCVVLNACFSEAQAKVISRHIEIVIGMSQDIGDEAAIKFSEGFYDALGAGRSAEKAFEFGRSAIDLRSLQERLVPVILRNPEIRRLTRASASGNGPKRIVPRGLRSFQPEDSDFFLELLPGPRGPDGLPTSLRFWKTRIEERNPDRTFSVGLIYGPSGCGKSSLVKAGLLPRLSDTIQTVFIEATADDTETRLLNGLRGEFPGLGSEPNLIDTFITLRRESGATGKKTLIVIDQFEQWLHAKTDEEKTDLALALRLCDGANVQCIVMIRDDFWLGTNRLMKDIGVHISEGENAALVDLFDVRHARKVLGLFADAYGVWEDSPVEPTERAQFLDDAVSGLAQGDRVICVRMALFCELFHGKPWDLKTLEKAGGVEGVGVLFMEETFSADNAPAENRYHQKAVRSVLNALLPEPGSKIKGRMRSHRDLIDVSGYADRPDDFQEVVRILDEKTHLITPTDPEGLGAEEGGVKRPSVGRFYQLTHDYLVPSIREWLTRKQRETSRGRAELRLADRSAIWAAKPENRQLPSLWEWSNIRLLTKTTDWTEPQRRMMKKAGRIHASRTLAGLLLLGLLTVVGFEGYGTLRASDLVESLKTASTPDVAPIIEQLTGYRRWAARPLDRLLASTENQSGSHLRASLASLALWPGDGKQAANLTDRLLIASPVELPVIWGILSRHDGGAKEQLWKLLGDPKADPERRFRAGCALANSDSPRVEDRWGPVTPFLTDRFLKAVIKNPGDYAPLIETLRPIRRRLLTPLASISRDTGRSEIERNFATTLLADYAGDAPILVADLLMDAEPKAFVTLFPVAARYSAQTIPIFQAEIEKATYPWNDPPLDQKWTSPDPALVSQIEAAQGILAERFAYCQTMTLDDFLALSQELRKSGYRPTRFRPYADGPVVRVAAIWSRDGRDWVVAQGMTDDDVHRMDEKQLGDGYLAVDVAGYLTGDHDGKAVVNYSALWVKRRRPDEKARVYAGVIPGEHITAQDQLKKDGFGPSTLQAVLGPEGTTRYSGVWNDSPNNWNLAWDQSETTLGKTIASRPDSVLLDVSVNVPEVIPSRRDRDRLALESAEENLKKMPEDFGSRFARARAFFSLGEWQKALDDLNTLAEQAPKEFLLNRYRSLAHAHLGHKAESLADLAQYRKGDGEASDKLATSVVVTAVLGEGEAMHIAALENALKQHPRITELLYDASCAYSLASVSVSARDKDLGRDYADKALTLLARSIDQGYSDYDHFQEDADLDPIRQLPEFSETMKEGHLDRHYAAVWGNQASREAIPIYGLDTAVQMRRSRPLIAQGFRPISLSVARTTPEGPLVTASVWQRPQVREEAKDQSAERKARAAVSLVRMGEAELVWPLLKHSPDPRLRSFIMNWLNPLGTDPGLIIAELNRIDPRIKPTVAEGQQAMDAVLFHPETSMRRALILALGTYGTEGLSPAERESLSVKLLDLYRNDPDAGIHGASEWTLRQWKQREKLKGADAELMTLRDRGDRRWTVNGQGQTFAVFDGPTEFLMGSPPTEPGRDADETLSRVRIPRRFAISSKEVSVEQYQRFVKTNPEFETPQYYLDTHSPDPSGPMILVSWYRAAAYCNWLSEQEGLPENQWCYVPSIKTGFGNGMTIPADVLLRTGYRLPTKAEWEYSCRSGTITSRYHGLSTNLLGTYARYQANSREHAWPCGSLMPNDSGLFDMLGNVLEWCQGWQRTGINTLTDNVIGSESVNESPRLLLGGAFDNPSSFVRSAFRFRHGPGDAIIYFGFRPARTYH